MDKNSRTKGETGTLNKILPTSFKDAKSKSIGRAGPHPRRD
jgi:hypothetical protein